jgi:transposase
MAIDYKSKKQVVESVLSGKSHQEAIDEAQITISVRSVYRWVQDYREDGESSLYERRRGVVWKVSDEIRAWIVECCEETRSLSAKQLQAQLEETFGVVVSISHINQIRIDENVSKSMMSPPKKSK